MSVSKGPIPYQEFNPKSDEYLPTEELSAQRARLRFDAWFWIGAGGLTLLSIALWPVLVGTVAAGIAAGLCAVAGVLYLLRPAKTPSPAPVTPHAPHDPLSYSSRHRISRALRAGILFVAAGMLIGAIFVPWYTEVAQSTTASGSSTYQSNLYLGQSASVTITNCSTVCSTTVEWTNYADMGLNATGHLYEAGLAIVVLAAVLAGIAGVLSIAAGSWVGTGDRWSRTIAVVAAFVAFIAPVLFFAVQPGVISSDLQSAAGPAGLTAGTGPWSSFWGTYTSYPYATTVTTQTWGGGPGWGLAVASGFVLVLAALIPVIIPVPKDRGPA